MSSRETEQIHQLGEVSSQLLVRRCGHPKDIRIMVSLGSPSRKFQGQLCFPHSWHPIYDAAGRELTAGCTERAIDLLQLIVPTSEIRGEDVVGQFADTCWFPIV